MIGDLLTTFLDTLYALRTFSAYGAIALSSLMLNLGYGAMIYCAFLAFDLQATYNLGVEAALAVLAISSLGMVVPTPAGTGTYHKFFSEGLILLFAVPAVPALACATALHAIGNLTYLAIGGPALLLQKRGAASKE